jgi:hypothetical protein
MVAILLAVACDVDGNAQTEICARDGGWFRSQNRLNDPGCSNLRV